MAEAVVAGCAPIVGVLEPGTYWWCACGRSKTQPYCDGSHEGTGIEPMEMVIEAAKKCALCTCKQTKKAPLCDGSHKTLPGAAGAKPPVPPAQP